MNTNPLTLMCFLLLTFAHALSALGAQACDSALLSKLLDRQIQILEDVDHIGAGVGAVRVKIAANMSSRVSAEEAELILREAAGPGADLVPDPILLARVHVRRGDSWYTFEKTMSGAGPEASTPVYVLRGLSQESPRAIDEILHPLTGRAPAPRGPSLREDQWNEVLASARREQLPAANTKSNPSDARELAEGSTRIFFYHPPPRTRAHELPSVKHGGRKGFLDHWGNVWISGPSRTAGEAFEWDVQVALSAPKWMKDLSGNGKYINVSLTGRISH